MNERDETKAHYWGNILARLSWKNLRAAADREDLEVLQFAVAQWDKATAELQPHYTNAYVEESALAFMTQQIADFYRSTIQRRFPSGELREPTANAELGEQTNDNAG